MSATAFDPRLWSEAAVNYLRDAASCPSCGTGRLLDQRCVDCGIDLSGGAGAELWQASMTAASALERRQEALERVRAPRAALAAQPLPGPALDPVTMTAIPAASQVTAPDVGTAVTSSEADIATPLSSDGPSATVQSVLAVAGAGLFAIAAIVFTFFNVELTDHVLRSTIVGGVTLLFAGGAWLLARRRLQFSAEVVGALAMVFVALDVYAFSEAAPAGVSAWIFAAVGTLIGGAIMATAAMRSRIRTWLWLSLLGLATVPAMLGYSGGTTGWAVLGHLSVMLAATGAIELTFALERRLGYVLSSERAALTTVQFLAMVTVIGQANRIETDSSVAHWLTLTAVLVALAALAALASRRIARRAWSITTGGGIIGAVTTGALALSAATELGIHGFLALVPLSVGAALVVAGTLVPLPSTIARLPFTAGALGVFGIVSVPATALALAQGATTALSPATVVALAGNESATSMAVSAAIGVAAVSAALGAFGALVSRRGPFAPNLATTTTTLSLWFAALAVLALACVPPFLLWGTIALALAVGVVASAATILVPRMRASSVARRLPLVVGAHLGVLLAAIVSRSDEQIVVWAGIPVIAALVLIAKTVPPRARFVYVAVGYAYALVVFATALDRLGVGAIALLCLTSGLGSAGAIVATFLRRVRPPAWYAVLAVTTVPFLIGVAQVVFERSGWTALSTGMMFLLALTLLITRRRRLALVLRAAAAALLVPSLAVVIVCLGAQILTGSASPATLPVIAALVALVLPSTLLISSALERHGIGARAASVARVAIEGSALLTGALAVALALVRDAAGLPTSFVVLLILGIGGVITAVGAERRYGWWVAGAAFTGALWCAWAIAGVDVLEPYLLPPALCAALVGAVITARGARGLPLYASGLLVALVPVLVVLAVAGSGPSATAAWRGYGMLAASWVLTVLGMRLGRGDQVRARRLRPLRLPTLVIAVGAASAGMIQAVRFGVGLDTVVIGGVPLVVLCLGLGLAGALPAAAAGRGIHSGAVAGSTLSSSRWLYSPALLFVGVAASAAIEQDWFTIWTLWALMLAYLAAMVAVAWRLRSGPTTLPPVWFVFAIAFGLAVTAWSPRDLRVEWFSLPLGLFLVTAGIVMMRVPPIATHPHPTHQHPTLTSWPAGWRGSWALLAPGIIVTMSASIVATFTDPLTWRAILVIVIALIAILIGASRRLAAPFLIGIIALPIENVFVFSVQIGRGIESIPWWITLSVVGAVLLIIAVTYERRDGDENSITARLRDLT